jgi:hypothetical protein
MGIARSGVDDATPRSSQTDSNGIGDANEFIGGPANGALGGALHLLERGLVAREPSSPTRS